MHHACLTLGVITLLVWLLSETGEANPPAASSARQIPASDNHQAPPIDYLRDVRPLLSDNCYACHGPDEEAREANLRLDERAAAMAATDLGVHAIVPGKPAESEALRRLTSDDPAELMPPPDTGKKLSAEQIELIRRWIAQGAPWNKHWSLVAPERPELPRLGGEGSPRNAIDRFVLARLEEHGWQPSLEADKETLIRRVTLHLTGLPPTLEEIEAFLADNSPDAYERVVDRLLASKKYGEHMARYWLDAARYGDTHGLHLDNYREMWLYRDWVVKAFNTNLPYNQFIIEQLAGDLLPKPTADQLIATGFCRSHVTTNEGGSS
jgi:mono/diheme cytochrome c family protein